MFVRVDGKNILPCGGGVLVAGKNTCTGSAGILAGGPHGVVAYYTDIIGSGTSNFTDGESAVQDLPVSRAKTSTTLTLAKPVIGYGHEEPRSSRSPSATSAASTPPARWR